jgi:hypothetical protein
MNSFCFIKHFIQAKSFDCMCCIFSFSEIKTIDRAIVVALAAMAAAEVAPSEQGLRGSKITRQLETIPSGGGGGGDRKGGGGGGNGGGGGGNTP